MGLGVEGAARNEGLGPGGDGLPCMSGLVVDVRNTFLNLAPPPLDLNRTRSAPERELCDSPTCGGRSPSPFAQCWQEAQQPFSAQGCPVWEEQWPKDVPQGFTPPSQELPFDLRQGQPQVPGSPTEELPFDIRQGQPDGQPEPAQAQAQAQAQALQMRMQGLEMQQQIQAQMQQQPEFQAQMQQPQDFQAQMQQPQFMQLGMPGMQQAYDGPVYWSPDEIPDNLPYMMVPVYGMAPIPMTQDQVQPSFYGLPESRPAYGAALRQYSPARQFYAPEAPGVSEQETAPAHHDSYPGARVVVPLGAPLDAALSPGSSRERSRERKERRERAKDRQRKEYCKVFVGGLAPGTTSVDLMSHFEGYGVKDAQVCADTQTRRSRGFGYLELDMRPPPGLLGEHIIDGRRCGVREYDYPTRRRGR